MHSDFVAYDHFLHAYCFDCVILITQSNTCATSGFIICVMIPTNYQTDLSDSAEDDTAMTCDTRRVRFDTNRNILFSYPARPPLTSRSVTSCSPSRSPCFGDVPSCYSTRLCPPSPVCLHYRGSTSSRGGAPLSWPAPGSSLCPTWSRPCAA